MSVLTAGPPYGPHHEPVDTAPAGCHGPGTEHPGPLVTLLFGCVHEHIGSEQACTRCVARLRDAYLTGHSAQCARCGHVCPCLWRVEQTGEVLPFNGATAAGLPWRERGRS